MDIIFYFLNSDENKLICLLLTRGRKNKWILIAIIYWASSSRLSSFVVRDVKLYCHIVRDVKLDAQGKLFVLTGFSVFIELCRVTGYLRLTLIFA